jgi:ribosome-binding protein aMBF1 (putative translation factor)
MDQLLKTPEPSSKAATLDLDESNASSPANPATARFGKPKSRRPIPPAREQSSSAITPSRRAPPPIATRSKGPGEARMRQIYESYVEAKRNNRERTDKIDYETVAKSLKKMVPKLDRKHKGKRIDFQVVVKDGKVGIKPVVKK